MKSLTINLSEEQIQNILGEGDKNPLYEPILTAYPEYNPIPTIESLHKEGEIQGYLLDDNGSIEYVNYITNVNAVRGLAPTKKAVERTVLEYKILQLIKANGLEGNEYIIVYRNSTEKIVFEVTETYLSGVLLIGGEDIERKRFIENYEELIKEYFSTFNSQK